MLELFYSGGPIYMSILTLELVLLIVSAVKFQEWVKELGLLALATGILGQLFGLYGAFEGIEQMGAVSTAMMAGGLKVSSISTIYGLLIYTLSLVIALVLKPRISTK